MLRAQIASPDLPEAQRPRQMLALAELLFSFAEFGNGDVSKVDEAIQVYIELLEKYGNQDYRAGTTFGTLAKASLFEIENLRIGKMAPDIEGQDMSGTPFKLSDYRGKVVMLTFWATWCGPCLAEVRHKRELVKRYHGRPFVIIGVSGDTDKAAAIPIIEKEMITWRSFWSGEKGPAGPIPRSWNVMGWPTNYVIDHAGVIKAKELIDDGIIEKLVVEAENGVK